MADNDRTPSVTFYVMAYNQARFVREAVEGALAQTYSPMQILLSDDCSTDETFAIMQDAIKGYQGPHTIVLNRNARNLGVSGHLNRIMELATGEFIIASDGDDISYACRTERCVEEWLRHGRPAALASYVHCIDESGRTSAIKDGRRWFEQFLPMEGETPEAALIRFSKTGSPRTVSCSGAWTKAMHQAFGPLHPGVWFEDDVLTLRAWLFDRIVFIREPLVQYREHQSNIFNRVPVPLTTTDARQRDEQNTRTEALRRRESLSSYRSDLDVALRQGWITPATHHELKRSFEAQSTFHQVIERWWSVNWLMRLGFFLFVIGSGRLREGRWCSARLLPFQVFIRLSAVWSRRQTGAGTPRLSGSHLNTMVFLTLNGVRMAATHVAELLAA